MTPEIYIFFVEAFSKISGRRRNTRPNFKTIAQNIYDYKPEALNFPFFSPSLPEYGMTHFSPGTTLLIEAVRFNRLSEVKVLLKYGANPNLWNSTNGGGYPLTWAASYNYTDIVLLLLKLGANPLVEEPLSPESPSIHMNALFWACRNEWPDVVDILLSQNNGAFINSQGMSAQDYFNIHLHINNVKNTRRQRIQRILILQEQQRLLNSKRSLEEYFIERI